MPEPLTILGITSVILLVAALISGIVERVPISFPMIFLGLGFLFGKQGLGLINIGPHDMILETVATLDLAFVFFLDALNLRFNEIRRGWILPALSIGPGTLLTILFVTIAAALLLRFPIILSILTGAVLASVDPVLLRDVVRDERIPRSIRESLRTEAATSDLIVLPILLVSVSIAVGQTGTASGWLILLLKVFILGPAVGAAVGAIAAIVADWVRKRTPVSREYRAVYGIGVLLAAYAAGILVGGSGFLAVFAAGFATMLLNYDVCDCFLEYGDVTAQMAMLLAFILFGALLSTLIGSVALVPALLFALVALILVRPAAMAVALRWVSISRLARLFIGWFGPRGLSSLLFALLVVSDGVPGSDQILAVAGIVVIISVVLHGVSSAPLAALYSRATANETYPEERESRAAGLHLKDPSLVPRIMPQELQDLLSSENPPIVLDVRSRSTYSQDEGQIPGSIRVLPDDVADWAADKPKDRAIVAYCS